MVELMYTCRCKKCKGLFTLELIDEQKLQELNNNIFSNNQVNKVSYKCKKCGDKAIVDYVVCGRILLYFKH